MCIGTRESRISSCFYNLEYEIIKNKNRSAVIIISTFVVRKSVHTLQNQMKQSKSSLPVGLWANPSGSLTNPCKEIPFGVPSHSQ